MVGIGSALGPRGASLRGGGLTVGSVGLFRAHADPVTLRRRRVGTSVEMTVYVMLRRTSRCGPVLPKPTQCTGLRTSVDF